MIEAVINHLYASLDTPLTQATIEVGLPVLIGINMEAGEPAATAWIGIDADGVAEVGRDVRLLGGVTTDHNLTRHVRFRGSKLLVNQSKRLLLIEWDVVFEIGVNEDVGVRFQIGSALSQELPVGRWNIIKSTRAIGFKRLGAAPYIKPVSAVGEIHF